MKIVLTVLVTFLAICAINAAPGDKHVSKAKRYSKIQRECKQQTGVNQTVIAETRRGNFAEDKSLQQYLLCISKKIGYQDNDGKLVEDRVKVNLKKMNVPAEKLDELYNKCVVQKETPESTAWFVFKCFRQNADVVDFESTFFKDEHLDKVRKFNKECSVESKLNKEAVEDPKFEDTAENEALGNHLFCIFQKLDYQNELGEIQSSHIRKNFAQYIDDETLEELVSKCAVNKDTPQMTAFTFNKCISDNSPFSINFIKVF